MSQKFLINAVIVAVVAFVLSLFLATIGMIGNLIACLVAIGLTIFMYKNYADAEENKSVLTVVNGVKFGLIVGLLAYLLNIGNTAINPDGVRQQQIDGIESFRGMASGNEEAEQQMDDQIAEVENMSDGDIIAQSAGLAAIGFTLVLYSIIGLIAGAIFKHDEDDE